MAEFEIKKGNTWVRTASFLDVDGGVFDFTGCTVWWTLKLATDDSNTDDNAIIKFHWTLADSLGISIPSPTSGEMTITLSPLITSSLKLKTEYKYDIKIKNLVGRIDTVDNGHIKLKDVVTIRETIP